MEEVTGSCLNRTLLRFDRRRHGLAQDAAPAFDLVRVSLTRGHGSEDRHLMIHRADFTEALLTLIADDASLSPCSRYRRGHNHLASCPRKHVARTSHPTSEIYPLR